MSRTKIVVAVKTNASRAMVLLKPDNTYQVSVVASPIDGKANAAVIKILAAYFAIAPSLITIVAGHTTRRKLIEIDFD